MFYCVVKRSNKWNILDNSLRISRYNSAMKYIALLLLFVGSSLLACTGDCLTCHPKLLATIHDDPRHKPMLGCIDCHSADPDAMSECGSDCFGCHPIEKIEKPGIKEHNVIRECRDCHLELQKEALDITNSMGQSMQKPLKELLLN